MKAMTRSLKPFLSIADTWRLTPFGGSSGMNTLCAGVSALKRRDWLESSVVSARSVGNVVIIFVDGDVIG